MDWMGRNGLNDQSGRKGLKWAEMLRWFDLGV